MYNIKFLGKMQAKKCKIIIFFHIAENQKTKLAKKGRIGYNTVRIENMAEYDAHIIFDLHYFL